jgi:hypothetical protein
MTQETKKRIHAIYGIVLSVVAVLAGICFIAACLNIYRGGAASNATQIYTRQIVGESFAGITIPVYSCLVLVMGGMVLDLALPIEKKKLKPEKNLPLILQRLQEKTDLEACSSTVRSQLKKHSQLRKNGVISCGILLVGSFALFLIYACNPAHWDTNSTPSMVAAMGKMFSCLAVPFLVTVVVSYLCRKSMEREIELMRQAAAEHPRKAKKEVPKAHSNRIAAIARIAILAAGILLVVLGACNEGTADILTKAVNICTECVGLG